MWYEAFAWVICGICCIALTITVIYYFQKAIKEILKDLKEKNETIKEISKEIKELKNKGGDQTPEEK